MFDNLGSLLLGGVILLCVLPIVIVAVVGFFVLRSGQERLNNVLDPDVSRLQERFQKLKTQNPTATDEMLIGKIIQGQALRCGIVGAITGFGGFLTLPIALPVDIIASLYLQAGLVNFIAAHYGQAGGREWEQNVRSYLVVSGGGQVTQTTSRALIGFLVRVIGKSFSKLVPVFSAAISFVVNYLIAQAMGQVALRWYTTRRPTITA
jgi:hypothetical protein